MRTIALTSIPQIQFGAFDQTQEARHEAWLLLQHSKLKDNPIAVTTDCDLFYQGESNQKGAHLKLPAGSQLIIKQPHMYYSLGDKEAEPLLKKTLVSSAGETPTLDDDLLTCVSCYSPKTDQTFLMQVHRALNVTTHKINISDHLKKLNRLSFLERWQHRDD
jgi:hypothetical protein